MGEILEIKKEDNKETKKLTNQINKESVPKKIETKENFEPKIIIDSNGERLIQAIKLAKQGKIEEVHDLLAGHDVNEYLDKCQIWLVSPIYGVDKSGKKSVNSIKANLSLKQFIRYTRSTNNQGGLFYNRENPDNGRGSSISGQIEKGSDTAILIQLAIMLSDFSIKKSNTHTMLQSIDGDIGKFTLQGLSQTKEKYTLEDDKYKDAYIDFRYSLPDQKQLDFNSDLYPVMNLASFGKTTYFDIDGKLWVNSKNTDGTPSIPMELTKDFVLIQVNKKLSNSKQNQNTLHAVMGIANTINLSRACSSMYPSNTYRPFFVNQKYGTIMYDVSGTGKLGAANDLPLMKVNSAKVLLDSLKSFDNMPIDAFVTYLNDIHERDYRPLPKSKLTHDRKNPKF